MRNPVLLYSGGLDSVIMAALVPEAILLYIDSGAGYTTKELDRSAPRELIIVRDVINLARYELPSAIVPARNLYLVAIAANYGDTILLGSTAGDNSTDKDDAFADMAGALLSHIYDCNHFNREIPITVRLPGKKMSKGELVRQYLSEGNDPKVLLEAVSCYDSDTDGHCGQCKACIRKWAALASNNINDDAYDNHPLNYDWQPIIDTIRSEAGWRCADEDRYTMALLVREGIAK